MPRLVVLLAGLLCMSLLGCAAAPQVGPVRAPGVASAPLLFDRHLGPYTSDDFTYREDWPVGPRAYDAGETIYYVEFTSDIEGRHGFHHEETRREFRSYRTGFVRR